MSRGDHVYVRRWARLNRYSHHGIDCGDGTVIHYVGGLGTLRRVERTSWPAFAGGSQVLVRDHRDRVPVEEIVANAESRVGGHGYHLVKNNCEHFATWASTGSASSRQVRRWAMAAPGAVTSLGVAEAAGIHLMILGSLSAAAYAVARPLGRYRRRLARRLRRAAGSAEARVAGVAPPGLEPRRDPS
jgi:hypothetical protein